MAERATIIELEMGYSMQEFASVLPAAMRDLGVGGASPHWQVSDTDGSALASIAIAPKQDRRLGALALPVLDVRIDFSSDDAEARKRFMHYFERGFHRGGG